MARAIRRPLYPVTHDHNGRKADTDLHLNVNILDVDPRESDGVAARKVESKWLARS